MPGTVIQIEGVGNVEFPDGMKPEEVSAAAHRLYTGAGAKQIEQNPPGVPSTGTGAPPNNPIDQAAQQNAMAPQAGLPGGTSAPHEPSDKELIGRAAPVGALALGAMGASGTLGTIARQAWPFAASAGINAARSIPGIGQHIPRYSELAPFILAGFGGKGGAEEGAEAEAINEGRAMKMPTRLNPKEAETFRESQLGEPSTPKIGAVSKIPTTPGFDTPTVGETARIPVRQPEPMKPFGAAGATEGGGQLPEVIVAPEPRPPIPGVPPGSMQSVPRNQLAGHIMTGTPGAAEAGQAIGMKPIFLTPGAEFEMGRPAEAPSNLLQFPGEPVPEPLNGPQIMDRLGEIHRNMGTGTEGLPAIRTASDIAELPEVNERGQRLGVKPIEMKGTPQEINKADHPDYNEKGQHLGVAPEVEDVGGKVRTETEKKLKKGKDEE